MFDSHSGLFEFPQDEFRKPFWASMTTKTGLLLMVQGNKTTQLLAGNFSDGTLRSQILDLSAMPSNMGGDSRAREHRL
jgi:hypothetical protein